MINKEKTLKIISYYGGMQKFTYYNQEDDPIDQILPYLSIITDIDGRTNRITRHGLEKEFMEYNKLSDLPVPVNRKTNIESVLVASYLDNMKSFSKRSTKRMVNI